MVSIALQPKYDALLKPNLWHLFQWHGLYAIRTRVCTYKIIFSGMWLLICSLIFMLVLFRLVKDINIVNWNEFELDLFKDDTWLSGYISGLADVNYLHLSRKWLKLNHTWRKFDQWWGNMYGSEALIVVFCDNFKPLFAALISELCVHWFIYSTQVFTLCWCVWPFWDNTDVYLCVVYLGC